VWCAKRRLKVPTAKDGLTSLMQLGHWYYYRQPGKPQVTAENGWPVVGNAWQVRTVPEPPAGADRRNFYDIATHCCFVDFRLEVEFRCPNQRSNWTDCTSATTGPRNWGNSGVIVQDSYEVQIMDSAAIAGYDGSKEKSDSTGLGACKKGQKGDVPYAQVCGAIYNQFVPSDNTVETASNVIGKKPPEPGGDWNSMSIVFMSARYENDKEVKLATISVTLNTKRVIDRVGLGSPSGNRAAPGSFGQVPDTNYGKGWKVNQGPLLLQEHDNKVEFRGLLIDVGWKPVTGSGFDPKWQRDA
jgi:hypothetical protein